MLKIGDIAPLNLERKCHTFFVLESFFRIMVDVTKTGNGEWGMGNGEWGMGNGEWGMGNEK